MKLSSSVSLTGAAVSGTSKDFRIVGSGGMIAITTAGGGSNNFFRSEKRQRVVIGGQNVSEIRIVYYNGYVRAQSGSLAGELDGPTTLTLEAALEMNTPALVNRITFSGSNTVNILPGQIVVSDAILPSLFSAPNFPSSNVLWVRTGIIVQPGTGNTWTSFKTLSVSGESSRTSNSPNSQIMATGALTTPANGVSNIQGFGAVGIIGRWSKTPDVSIGLMGDSIADGQNDANDTGVAGGGAFVHGFRNSNNRNIPVTRLTRGTDQADGWSQNSKCRKHMMQYCTHLVASFGTNDLIGSFDTANTWIKVKNIISDFKRYGKGAKRVIWIKVPPRTSSTDSWATVVNQTPVTDFATGGIDRDAFNSILTSNTGVFGGPDELLDINLDWADTVSLDKWRAANTVDGVHPEATPSQLAAIRVNQAANNWTTT